MKTASVIAAAVAAVALTGATAASAATPLWEFDTPAEAFTNGNWDFGNGFTTNGSETVYALGYYYDPNNPWLDNGHDVSLYTAAGVLVASATVSILDPLIGHFKYASITPVAINGSYEIDGESLSAVYTWDDPGFFSNVTYDYNTWTLGAGDAYQGFAINDVTDGYWGPNALLSPLNTVPEPAAWAMMILGVSLVGAMARRRRVVAATV